MIEIPKKIKQSLKFIGFDMAHQQTIMYLFQHGLSSTADIASGVKLPRTTIHLAIQELLQKQVIGVSRSGKRKIFYIENPEKLKRFIDYEQIELANKYQRIETILPDLRTIFAIRGDSEKIDIEHFAGEEGFIKIFYKSLEQDSGGEVLRFSGNPEKFTVGREDLKEYRVSRIKKKIYTRILIPESPFSDDEKREARTKFRDVRILDKAIFNPNVQVSVWKHSVAFTIWDTGLHSIVITNKSIAEFIKTLFEISWSQAR